MLSVNPIRYTETSSLSFIMKYHSRGRDRNLFEHYSLALSDNLIAFASSHIQKRINYITVSFKKTK